MHNTAEHLTEPARIATEASPLPVERDTLEEGEPSFLHIMRGTVAMAECNPLEAVRSYKELRNSDPSCNLPTCLLFNIGLAFDSAGMSDSAIAYFERVLTEPATYRLWLDSRARPLSSPSRGAVRGARRNRERRATLFGLRRPLGKRRSAVTTSGCRGSAANRETGG